MGGRIWSETENRTLTLGWGEWNRRLLMSRLRGRTWRAIQEHATTELGLPGGLPQGYVTISGAARRLGCSTKAVRSLAERHRIKVLKHPCPYTIRVRPTSWLCVEWDTTRTASERETLNEEVLFAAAKRRGINAGWLWFLVRDAGLLPPLAPGRIRRPHTRLPTAVIDELVAAAQARRAA